MNNVSHRQLQFFVVAAEAGSFTEASQLLHVTPPALSTAIKNLEQDLGGQLFERRQRRIQLSPEGEYFLPIAKNLLREWQDSLDLLQQRMHLNSGSLTIAAMPSFANHALPPCLARFQKLFPEIQLRVRDVVMEDVIDLVERQQVDMGLTFQADRPVYTRFIELFTDTFIAVVPPQHAAADKGSIQLADLLDSTLITLNRESAARNWVEEALQTKQLQATRRIECMNLATVGAMVAAGVGVSIVPELCRQPMLAQGAIPLRLNDVKIARPVGIHLPVQSSPSVATRAMQDILGNTILTSSAVI